MKKDEIVSTLKELYNISGFRVSIHGTDFAEMAAYPDEPLPFCRCLHRSKEEYESCLQCDREACRRVQKEGKTTVYKCRHGLTEVVSPLYNFGTLTGYLMMGQVSDGETDRAALLETAKKHTDSLNEAKRLVESITTHPADKIASFVRIHTICAEHITLTNALPSSKPSLAELAKYYIMDNYDKKITLTEICRAIGCSKSTLISIFKQEYGTTVNAYISEVRIAEAKELLSATEKSISEIAEITGFYDQAYLSKVFSARMGISPSEYRRKEKA